VTELTPPVVAACTSTAAPGDERHTRRALVNVLKNALEHSPPGAAVEVQAATTGGVSSVTVTDHGEGIPPGELEHIFDRFYRADPARSLERAGSGLGLAIARWALRRMGGDLVAASTLGSGTRVTLTLPTPRS
jgi:signal transduction histidine kinase